jgi:hypothetical protein
MRTQFRMVSQLNIFLLFDHAHHRLCSLDELVQDGENGLVFNHAEQLTQQLQVILVHKYTLASSLN